MNNTATVPDKRRITGMRAAAVIYLLVVFAGIGGTGAHALWAQTGTAAATVIAGAWAPKPVAAGTVSCSVVAGSDYTDLTLTWAATDASSYTVTASRNSSMTTVTTGTARATLRLERLTILTQQAYTLTITPQAGGITAQNTLIQAKFSRILGAPSVDCTPQS